MSRILQERWLIADKTLGMFTANKAIFIETSDGVYGLNPNIKDNQLVMYNADTGVSVGVGVTAAQCPNLVIATGIDTNKDGVADVLRTVAFKRLAANTVNAVTAEPPVCGQSKIVDVGIGCVKKGESYSLTVEVRNEEYERLYDNSYGYERFTETVEFGYDECDNCDEELSCKEVACALANKFNGVDKNYSLKKNISLLKRVREHQQKDMPFTVYVLHENDYQFCFNTTTAACKGCVNIPAITGMKINAGQENEEVFNFTGLYTGEGVNATTSVNQVESIIKMINKHLGDRGTAVNAAAFSGSAKPCCDGIKILVNACVPVQLLDHSGASITPCSTGLPIDNVIKKGACGSCAEVKTSSPCAYLRVVPKPINLEKYCDRPDSWLKTLYTDIRIASSTYHNNFGFYKEFVRQDYVIPRGLVYEVQHHALKQDTSLNEPFSWGYDEYYGAGNFVPGSRTPAMGKGLFSGCDTFDTVCVYNIEHQGPVQDTLVASNPQGIHFRTKVVIPSDNVGLKTEFESILNPWLASIPGKLFKTVTCSVDQDQIEREINGTFEVTQAEYPNSNGNIIAG